MIKLRNKMFMLLVSILSIFLFSMGVIFNIRIYNQEYKSLVLKIEKINNYDRISDNMFMDTELYVVKLDGSNVVSVYSSSNNLTSQDIINIINNNINRIGKIDNLYKNQYFLFISNGGYLYIINNGSIRNNLLNSLFSSLVLLVILEGAIVYISVLLTRWMVKPVMDTFNKQKQFISDASHELKTPLSVIMASADMMNVDDDNNKWLNNIKSEVDGMNKLVSNLLELSKTEELADKIFISKFNLSKVVESKALSFESVMFENGLRLELDISSDIEFEGDIDRIRELVGILVDNAIKHGDKNTSISVSLSCVKDIITLKVKNKGDAIPKEEREKIFMRFYRGDTARGRKDNRYGLGLAIASNIVHNHRGEISVDCHGGYTVFKVTFKVK